MCPNPVLFSSQSFLYANIVLLVPVLMLLCLTNDGQATTDPTTADVNTSSDDLIQMLLLNNFSVIPIVNNKQYVGVVSRHTIMDAHLSPDYNAFSAKERHGRFVYA